MAGIFRGIGNFFRDIVKESKIVTWPTRKDLFKYTVVVVITVVFLAVFFVLVDMGITQLMHLVTGQ
ncbi:MAG: preprotein translocase subunit SecE [Sporolactobacillus sp.]